MQQETPSGGTGRPAAWATVILLLVLSVARMAGDARVVASGPEATLDPPVVEHDALLAASLERITEEDAAELVGGLGGERPVTIDGARLTLTHRWCSRRGEPSSNSASPFAVERLRRQGLAAEIWTPFASSVVEGNVLAEIQGEVRPWEVVIVLAHLDSDSHKMPGADDNASGSAAVMLAAQALARHRFERTIRFFLSAQEFSGSGEYADRMYQDGEDVVAVINMDMIGHDLGERQAKVFAGYPDDATFSDQRTIAEAFVDAAAVYCPNLAPMIRETCG